VYRVFLWQGVVLRHGMSIAAPISRARPGTRLFLAAVLVNVHPVPSSFFGERIGEIPVVCRL